MVKNTMIVPVGAKGGFVASASPRTPARRSSPGEIACYDVHPRPARSDRQHRRRTRSSHRARSCGWMAMIPTSWSRPTRAPRASPTSPTRIAGEYRFWLGDAFASGGSAGYDHKKMGITARGAWVSVKRHFRELGRDLHTERFTVAGIGDMSGDVFGNGMLRSAAHPPARRLQPAAHLSRPRPGSGTQLSGAPAPVPPAALGLDRLRPPLISRGGGVYERGAKSIPLAREAQALLDLPPTRASPPRSCAPFWRSRSTCSGTAGSAPTSRPAASVTARSAIMPTMPCASTGGSCAPGGRRRRQPRVLAARPDRVRARAAAG